MGKKTHITLTQREREASNQARGSSKEQTECLLTVIEVLLIVIHTSENKIKIQKVTRSKGDARGNDKLSFLKCAFFKPNHWWRSNSPSVRLHQWPRQHRQLLKWARHREKLFTHSDEFEFNYRSHNSFNIYILRKYQTFICVRNFDQRVAHWLVSYSSMQLRKLTFNFFFPKKLSQIKLTMKRLKI